VSVRSALSPLGAAIGAALRRRSLLILLIATLGVFGLMSWGSFSDLRSQRNLLDKAERGELRGFDLFQLRISTNCDGQTCTLGTQDGRSTGITFPQPTEEQFNEFDPNQLPPELEVIEQNLPTLVSALRETLEEQEHALSPPSTLRSRIRAAGTFWGVLFAVLAGASLLGAEWRWGVWRTLLTHEPRRGRVLLSRFAMLWIVIAGGMAITLGFTLGTDALFRAITDVDATGGPGIATLARSAGKSLLSLEFYASMAGALATIVRTSFAGIGSLVFLLAEGLAAGRFHWLRHFLPAQQVATLIPQFAGVETTGYVWWPPILAGSVSCTATPGGFAVTCTETLLKPIPHWRAALVLGAWVLVATLLAWIFIRRRDVPQ
jgi:hypothetical protein